MKKARKALSVLLAALLLLSLCSVFASAGAQHRYLVLGDSIGLGSGISNPDQACFGRIVANTNGYEYANDAVNGHRTVDLLGRLQEAGVISHVQWADIISVSIGGNNFLRGNMTSMIAQIQAGNYAIVDEIVAGVATDLDAIVARIRSLNPNAAILLQTLYNPAPSASLTPVYQQAIDRLNAVIKACAANADALVDVETAFAANNELISWDNIHPNAAGNVVIAREVLKTLKAMGLGTETEPVIATAGRDWAPTGPAVLLRKILTFFLRFFSQLFK